MDCGRTKAIGLSNFNEKQIQRVLDNCRIKPDNLQIEHHLYLQQPELLKFCKDNEITVTSYSTLGTKDGRQILGISQKYVYRHINIIIFKLNQQLNCRNSEIILFFCKSRVVFTFSSNFRLNVQPCSFSRISYFKMCFQRQWRIYGMIKARQCPGAMDLWFPRK